MSGEFGTYHVSGYFHYQIEVAADDCLQGGGEITRLWGEFLNAFVPVAHEISWFEAADSGVDAPIVATLEHLTELRAKLRAIENYVEPFKRAAPRPVRDAVPAETGRS